YEQVHKVLIRDDALVAAAELSNRYITGRQLPDKAIDLLDTACARIKVNLSSKPDFFEDRERKIQMLEREKNGLVRDAENRILINPERPGEIDAEMAQIQAELQTLKDRFQAQADAARKVLDLRKERSLARSQAEPTSRSLADIETELTQAEQQFNQLQAEEKLIFVDVSPDTVAK